MSILNLPYISPKLLYRSPKPLPLKHDQDAESSAKICSAGFQAAWASQALAAPKARLALEASPKKGPWTRDVRQLSTYIHKYESKSNCTYLYMTVSSYT